MLGKKRGKEEIFTVLGRKKYDFRKKGGGGKNINYFDNIHTCLQRFVKIGFSYFFFIIFQK